MSALKQTKRLAVATQVEIFDGAASLGIVPLSEDGRWTIDVNNLADGTHTFTARVVGTALVSAPWRVVVPTYPRVEDFESVYINGLIPQGTIKRYPTLEYRAIGSNCTGFEWPNNDWKPWNTGKFIQSRTLPLGVFQKQGEYTFHRPVRKVTLGLYTSAISEHGELRAYDANGDLVATHVVRSTSGGETVIMNTSNRLIKRIDVYCSGQVSIDEMKLEY